MGILNLAYGLVRHASQWAVGDDAPFTTTEWLPPDNLLPRWLLASPVQAMEGLEARLRALAPEVRLELGSGLGRVGRSVAVVPTRVPDPASLWYLAELVSKDPACASAVLGAYEPGLELEACWVYTHGVMTARSGQSWRDIRAYARHNPERFSGVPPTEPIARAWPMTRLAARVGLSRQELLEELARLGAQ